MGIYLSQFLHGLVKLNNFLMGTATNPYQSITQGTLLVKLVKLNNPLTGTETYPMTAGRMRMGIGLLLN